MRKILVLTLVLTLVIGASVVFADSPMQIVESITGKSLTELHDLRQEGKTLADIAEEEGVTEELKDALYNEAKERMDTLVDEGKTTQDKADAYLADYQDRLDEGYFGMPGGRRGQGGFRGWAEENGLSEAYQEKIYEAQKAFVEEALEEDKITQEEADDILEQIELRHENGGPLGGPGQGCGGPGMGKGGFGKGRDNQN